MNLLTIAALAKMQQSGAYTESYNHVTLVTKDMGQQGFLDQQLKKYFAGFNHEI